MKTKSKYEQVADILEKEGYISDSQTFKIWGNLTGLYTVGEHIRKYKKLKADRNFFADKKIIDKIKGHRSYYVRIEMKENRYYKVGKEFFNEIVL